MYYAGGAGGISPGGLERNVSTAEHLTRLPLPKSPVASFSAFNEFFQPVEKSNHCMFQILHQERHHTHRGLGNDLVRIKRQFCNPCAVSRNSDLLLPTLSYNQAYAGKCVYKRQERSILGFKDIFLRHSYLDPRCNHDDSSYRKDSICQRKSSFGFLSFLR